MKRPCTSAYPMKNYRVWTTSNLLNWDPFERPVPSLRRMSREKECLQWLAAQQPSNQGGPYAAGKCKSIAALDIALGGLPAKMQVEAEVGTGVSAKTVGEFRKVTTC